MGRLDFDGTDAVRALQIAARNYLDEPTAGRTAVIAYWAVRALGTRLDNKHVDKILWSIANLVGRRET